MEIPFCKPQIGAKTETWLENSWRRSDNIVGDLEENYAITFHGDTLWKEGDKTCDICGVPFQKSLAPVPPELDERVGGTNTVLRSGAS